MRKAFVSRSKNYRCRNRRITLRKRNILPQKRVGQSNRVHVPPRHQRRLRVQFRPVYAFYSGQTLHRRQCVAMDLVGESHVSHPLVGSPCSQAFVCSACRCPVTPWVSSVCFRLPSDFANACRSSCCAALCTQGIITNSLNAPKQSQSSRSNVLPDVGYWAGNEPDILAPWLFVFGGCPHYTQYWTRWLVDHKYTTEPSGIPGNDDYGTMSAWLVFASLGFYPLSGAPFYIVGSPSLQVLVCAFRLRVMSCVYSHSPVMTHFLLDSYPFPSCSASILPWSRSIPQLLTL